MNKNALLLMIAAMLCPALAGISGMATLDAASAEFMANMGEAPAGSDNNSSSFDSISLQGRENLVSAPRNLSPGGYYSSHPISIGQGSGSRTQISNADSATFMSHEVGSAREMARNADYLVQSSGSRNAFGRTGSTTTQMRIEEKVTEGKVNMGVLVGEDGKTGAGQSRLDPRQSAWRNPAIEIEEEYIGTFNISKNLTYNSNYSLGLDRDCWLNCCGDDCFISLSPPKLIRADDVFNCHR